MNELEKCNEISKIIGKTIKHYKVLGNELDLTFTDNTKVYNLLNNPYWIRDEKKHEELFEASLTETDDFHEISKLDLTMQVFVLFQRIRNLEEKLKNGEK